MVEHLNRRSFVAGGVALVPATAFAADVNPLLGTPPSVISNPPRSFGPGAPPSIFPDPDVLGLDRSFNQLLIREETIKRISTGYELAEGPAWSAEGQYAIFSDVKRSILFRYVWESGEITPFRSPSYNSNGNSFDYEGRQLTCQDFFRRVIRWEQDGTMTVLADSFEGKPLNSPNDLAPHKDGSVWFTDPINGGTVSEGHPDLGDGPMNVGGLRDPRVGILGTGLIGSLHQVLPANVYRIDPSGRVDAVLPFEKGFAPNGICFSHDCARVYIIRGGKIFVADVVGTKIANLRLFTDCMVDDVHCGPDGMRCDMAGNVWAGSAAPLGYAGVIVWNPDGKLIGRIRLPEACANLCFAGPKRDYLFMAANQSIYMLHVNIQGASPG